MIQAAVTATAVDQAARQRRRQTSDNTGTLAERQLSEISYLEDAEAEQLTDKRKSLNPESSVCVQVNGEATRANKLPSSTTADNTSRQEAHAQTRVSPSHAGAASGCKAQPQITLATQQYTLAHLVDAVLQLTNEKLGANARIQQKIADEVLRTVNAADENDERGSLTLLSSLDRPPQGPPIQSSNGHEAPAGPSSGRRPAGPVTDQEVRDVYTHDLFVNNPTWTTFLVSSTDKKADLWSFKREEAATSCLGGFLHSTLRKELYMTLSHPDHSTTAYLLGVCIIGIILLNTATFCVESIPRYEKTALYSHLTIVDYVCMGIFTVEYLVRLACCPNLTHFLTSFNNTIDLVAILPFYVELMVHGASSEAFQTRVVRLLRVLRVLRIVKCMPKLRHLTLIADALRSSTDVLVMLAFLLTILLVLFGTIFYFVEPDTFDSIPQAMYYAQVTLTTTGYGDIYPTTPWGRFVAGISMLLCMVVVSLPITVIGGNFSEKWSDYKSFNAAVARSARVCPTQRHIKDALLEYENALDDVIAQLQAGETATERDLAFVRQQLASARVALERGGAVGTPLGRMASSSQRDAACSGGNSGALSAVRGLLRRVRSGAPNSSSNRYLEFAAASAHVEKSVSAHSVWAGNGQEGSLSGGSMAGVVIVGGGGVSGGGGGGGPTTGSSRQSKTAVGCGGAEAGAGAAGPGELRAGAALCDYSTNCNQGEAPQPAGGAMTTAADPSSAKVATTTPFASPSSIVVTAATTGIGLTEVPVRQLPPSPPFLTTTASVTLFPLHVSASVFAPCAPKKSFRAFALVLTNSVVSLLSGKKNRLTSAAFPSSAISSAAEGTVRQAAMDPGALVAASNALNLAAEACGHAKDVRVSHDTLASLARLLRTNEVHRKLEKLEEQYRVLRGWQDELGPMADHMMRLRDALDQLAWMLQEGVPEEERKYRPASADERQVQVTSQVGMQ